MEINHVGVVVKQCRRKSLCYANETSSNTYYGLLKKSVEPNQPVPFIFYIFPNVGGQCGRVCIFYPIETQNRRHPNAKFESLYGDVFARPLNFRPFPRLLLYNRALLITTEFGYVGSYIYFSGNCGNVFRSAST